MTSTRAGKPRTIITNLQALRAFAALNVVLYHCIGASPDYHRPVDLLAMFNGWGANGVDIFFVISGFVMMFTQSRKPKHPYDFALNRVIRIVPIYWILTTLLVTLVLVVPSAFEQARDLSFTRMATSYLFVSNPIVGRMPFIYVGWTLEYEMLFYVLFAASLFIRSEVARFIAVGVSIALCVIFLPYKPLAFEFLFGMGLGAYFQSGRTVKAPLLVMLAGVALLLATLATHNNELWRPILWGIPALLIVTGALYIRQTESFFLKLLGDASYSIYLVQIFTVPLGYRIVRVLPRAIPNDIMAVGVVAFTAVGGIACYYVLERPVTHFLRARLTSNRQPLFYPLTGSESPDEARQPV